MINKDNEMNKIDILKSMSIADFLSSIAKMKLREYQKRFIQNMMRIVLCKIPRFLEK